MYAKVILPCEPVALGEFVCSASEQVKKCVHLSIYNTSSITACVGEVYICIPHQG